MIDTWLKKIDEGNLVGAAVLDLRKAFDLVDHEILLHKLKLYHFSAKSLAFFASYLSHKQQVVKIGNMQSTKLNITSGVPQGQARRVAVI